MFGTRSTRELLKRADPARSFPTAKPSVSAGELIERAGEPSVTPRPRHTRRLTLAGTLAVGIVAASVASASLLGPDGQGTNRPARHGLVPIAYQIDDKPPPAAEFLRELAANLADAPYEHQTGEYVFHRIRSAGPVAASDGGEYLRVSHAEYLTWWRADGSGLQKVRALPPSYPDDASREYWERVAGEAAEEGGTSQAPKPGASGPVPATDEDWLPPDGHTLPADRAAVAEYLGVAHGGGAIDKSVDKLYSRFAVPKATRALVLEVLADVPGFVWRGHVTDRAGRPAVAISYDDEEHNQQSLIIFDAHTGVLLSTEHQLLEPERIVEVSTVILETQLRDDIHWDETR